MQINPLKSLTFRVTVISLLAFYSMIAIVMLAQYWSVKSRSIADFLETSSLHYNSLIKSNILANTELLEHHESEDIFKPFDPSGHNLAETIIFRKSTGEILVNEYLYIDDTYKKVIEDLAPETLSELVYNNMVYLTYRYDFGDYGIVYTSIFPNIVDYYDGLLNRWLIVIFASIAVFSGMALYFSRLVVRPIREHNASLSLYNTNLAHELKTPLAVVRSDLEMLELTDDKKFIASSREELGHIENIIDSLLFLTKKHIQREDFIEIDIIEFLQKIVKKCPQLTINNNFSDAKILKKVEPNLLMTLFKNILENASKYSLDHTLSIDVTEKCIIFSNPVAKNFSKKELKAIQELFYQVDTSRATSGYGIGISMMNRIADIFGWKLEFSSENAVFSVKIVF